MLKITNLNKNFGKFNAVNNVSLEVTEPGLYIFVGANGSGKTTLFNLVNGFLLPDSGSIALGKTSDTDQIRKYSGISTEPFLTEPNLSISEIIKIKRSICETTDKDCRNWIRFWELETAQYKSFKTLSTGMKKRLSLALSLMGTPQYLFWDEPFNGLDPVGIDLLNKLINNLIEQGKYLFLSTHLLNEITTASAHFYIMKDGRLIGNLRGNTKNMQTQILTLLKDQE